MRDAYDRVATGIIPAHAGKTPPRKQPLTSIWDHPRSRGENDFLVVDLGGEAGSSPLTRGKPRSPLHAAFARGIIPAHAGKTLYVDVVPSMKGDHPRSRGENVIHR